MRLIKVSPANRVYYGASRSRGRAHAGVDTIDTEPQALLGGQVDALFEQPGDVRKFLDAGNFKPILTVFNERPGVFSDVPTHKEMGMDFEPLLRFRGFYVHKDAPSDRVDWLKWAFQRAYCEDSYQAFNDSKFMNVIDSYRDTAGAIDMINAAIVQYRDVYKEMGLDVK